MSTEYRKETTDRAQAEGLAEKGKGIGRIPAYRRWLMRRLEAAEERGDEAEARTVRDRAKRAGLL